MAKFRVKIVDKFHGARGEQTVDIPSYAFDSKAKLASALRSVRLLMSGQSIRSMRVSDGKCIVFPKNAPGMTTGTHSLTLTPLE
jgi:hypothetical protein